MSPSDEKTSAPSVTLQQAFELAVQHHQAGRLPEAEGVYRQILAAEPRHPDALHNLGVMAWQLGRHDVASDMFRQSIVLRPDYPEAHSNLGNALKDQGRLDEAIVAHRQAIALRPDFPEAHNNLGNALKDQGHLDEAIAAYRQAIVLRPNYPEAHSNLGSALKDQGRLDEAVAAHRQAIALRPNFPEAHNNLGNALKDQGNLDEAIGAYRQAIVLRPNYPEAFSSLGNALKDQCHLDEAIAAYRQAIALKPDFAAAHSDLGNALSEAGRLDEAIVAHRRAIVLKPELPDVHYNLGVALHANSRLDEAIAAYRQAIVLRSDYPEACNNLGNALKDKGQPDNAIAAYRQVIALKPNFPEAYSNLGNALKDQGRMDEAITACHQAIALRPGFAEAYYNLGNALYGKGQLENAIAAYRQAIVLKPAYPEAHGNLGNALGDQGRLDEAIAAYRQAVALKPDLPEAHSNLLLTLNYHPGLDARAVADEARCWSRQHAEPLRPFIEAHGNGRDPGRRLRVGYVSPDFWGHSVAYFLEGLLAAHDRAEVEVYCYADVARPDAVTARLRQQAAHWSSITGMTDAQVAGLIRQDGIDILVDLSGHTARNRLLVFARRPAPVQVSWLGYPGTTGLETIDYRLTDAIADPLGSTEHLHSEELVRLPGCAWCFRPCEDAPPVSVPPALVAGCITFGCFNALAKINTRLLKLWSELLLAVPGSRLLLKNRSLQDAATRDRVQAMLENCGIAPERIGLAEYEPAFRGHLASYVRADIALDTFPYHGTTTTCEALWMGVPVVSLAGGSHVSRVGVSLLGNVGLPELVATSPEEYVRIAVELAGHLPRLAHLRSTLRERMKASPLMDAPRFARGIEAAYREMWHQWCGRQE